MLMLEQKKKEYRQQLEKNTRKINCVQGVENHLNLIQQKNPVSGVLQK